MKHLPSRFIMVGLLAASMLCGAQNNTSAGMNALAATPQADENGGRGVQTFSSSSWMTWGSIR